VKTSQWPYAALIFVLGIAAFFRLYGLAWDSGYLFHPDERKIVLVASGLAWPADLLTFLSSESPLNPKFFAYGSFPIYLLRALSAVAPAGPYGVPWREDYFVSLGLLGRVLSALFDLGTITLIFLLGRRLYDATIGLFASACVAVTVLHIQLSHFYAVDTLLTLLATATVFLAARLAETGRTRDAVWTGIGLGLAMATKVTAAPLIIPIVLAVVRANRVPISPVAVESHPPASWRGRVSGVVRGWIAEVWSTRRMLVRVLGVAFLVFVLVQPYVLLDPIRYFGQVGTEALVARGWLDYPYTRQYAGTIPFLYQIVQSTVWGMGVPLGIFAWVGTVLFVWQWWRTRDWNSGFVMSWALVYFLTIGAQHAKYLRYLLPMLPFLFLMAAAGFRSLLPGLRSRRVASGGGQGVWRIALYAFLSIVLLPSILYSLAFISMYSREHPWLQISRWIYANVPAGSTIATEHWDDTLPGPMQLNGTLRAPTEYHLLQLPMYDADDDSKLETLVQTLANSDYVLLASQRLYTTIPRLPARYPISSRYYQLLFDGRLGFELVDFARNAPLLGNLAFADETFAYAGLPVPPPLSRPEPGLTFWDWGHADESFTVYDHPMPLIMKKTRVLSVAEMKTLLSPNPLPRGQGWIGGVSSSSSRILP
jgi:hypothetical protein